MLHYRKTGEGPPLVLLHGLFGSLENLGGLARLLADNFSVYSVDLPNHGRSPHHPNMDLPAMAEAVAQWRASVGLERAFMLGHSLGGKVAMELALSAPDSCAALVVLDIAPVTYEPRHDRVFAGLLSIRPQDIEDRQQAEAILSQTINDAAVRSFLLKNLQRDGERFIWRMNLQDLHLQYPALIRANRQGVYPGPVLFLKGANSDYLQPQHESAIRSRFPAVGFKAVAGAGHWLHADKPDTVAVLVQRFLTSIPI